MSEQRAKRAMTRRRFFSFAGSAAVLGSALSAVLASCSSGPGSTSSAEPPAIDPDRPWWLQGNFAPVTREVETVDLAVQGSLPEGLNGLYVRNGSNARAADNGHWFLGDGMLHGVRLEEGRAAWYRNRWVRTTLFESGEGDFSDGPPGGDVSFSNVSVFEHGGRLLTSGEVGFPYEVDPTNLATVGPHDFDGRLTTSMTAHPKIDPATGHLHFFGYGFAEPYLTYHHADETGRLVSSQAVEVAGPTMVHDFAITDQDVVFWEFPVVFDLDMAVAGNSLPFRWDPSYGARIGVMPLGGPATAIRWVEVEPAYVFHGVNAFRDGDQVVVDVSQFRSMFEDGPLGESPELHRWTIDTGGDQLEITDDTLEGDRPMELPTRDPRHVGRAYRYAWLVDTPDPSDENGPPQFRGLLRRDFDTGELDRYEPGDGRSANEGLFVPDGDGEGEGWVFTYVYDAARDGSDFVVLDASDLGAGPVATVELPQRVPYGFHGTWVPA